MKNPTRRQRTHRMSRTPAYRSWANMLKRCQHPSNSQFHNYGGRGISVCQRWHLFINFLSDMGQPPQGMSLDRIDVNGNYEPKNCRWATHKEQCRNMRRNVFFFYSGKKMTLSEIAILEGVTYDRLYRQTRLNRFSVNKAISIAKRLVAPKRLSDRDVCRLRKCFASGKYTQIELARIFGISPKTASNILKNKRRLPYDDLEERRKIIA